MKIQGTEKRILFQIQLVSIEARDPIAWDPMNQAYREMQVESSDGGGK